MTQEQSEAMNKKWDKILGDEDFSGDLTKKQNQEGRADINWIYRAVYAEVIYYLKLDHDKVKSPPKVSEFFEGEEFKDYCYDKGDELMLDKIGALGISDVLFRLEQWVDGGYPDEDEYQYYHQMIRELKPKMQNH